ncbi:hypothetical protein PR048_011649 [Dryococelus australis]|uniref:Calponin-homology (CH) domain-containing protein n=1 Tax=Dryococelus australis TaxID=614101 RepID=A0ABQ9HM85_9NEOP|nr:hypothetical protein PR048_011649 [Dryococelus australis]
MSEQHERNGVHVGADISADEQDEMVATERELAEDAQWKRIQQNTFTRWANEHLKTVNKHIGNLETDLSDGLRLVTLIEVLSGKKMPKHNKRPTFRSQKLENVSVALKFLDDEAIRIVNIGESNVLLICHRRRAHVVPAPFPLQRPMWTALLRSRPVCFAALYFSAANSYLCPVKK